MFQEREEYRKSFLSSGELYVAGETLDIVSYDVSVKGVLVEMNAGHWLNSTQDIEVLIKEAFIAEVFVKDLMLYGVAHIVWSKVNNGKILVGLEFVDVQYNAQKLWRKRQYYRKSLQAKALLLNDLERIDVNTINLSVDGLMLAVNGNVSHLKTNQAVKIMIASLNMKLIAKIIWIKPDSETTIGLRYLLLS